jgi:hypothetical protein
MLLEGPDLKGILREVEANYGRDFHVIQAEQVRSGGVGGFFTKQHYEVTIEISNARAAADISAQPQTPGMPLSELATRSQNDQAAASTQDWARDLLEKARALNAPENLYGAGSDPIATTDEVDPDASSWSDLTTRSGKGRKFRLKLRNKKSARAKGNAGPSRTDPASVEQQKRLQDLLTHGPLIEDRPAAALPSPVEDDDDDFYDLPPAARLVAQMDGSSNLMRDSKQEQTKQKQTEVVSEEVKEVIAGVKISTPDPLPFVGERSGDICGPESEAYWRVQIGDQIKAQRDKVEDFYSRRGAIGPEEARRIQIFAMAETIARTLPTLPTKPKKAPAKSNPLPTQTTEPVVTAPKVATSKPAKYSLKFQAPDFEPVTHANAAIPQGIPTSAGEVLVLIGDVHEAYEQACAIIDVADCGGIDVLAITPSGLTVPGVDPEDHFRHSCADEVFDLARRSDSPTIVIVHAPFPIGNDDLERVRIVKAIEALETPHVWAIVDASHAISSLGRWTQCFGHISALAVVNAKEPRNPQTLRALGIPIVFMDGQPYREDGEEITSPAASPAVEQIASISV